MKKSTINCAALCAMLLAASGAVRAGGFGLEGLTAEGLNNGGAAFLIEAPLPAALAAEPLETAASAVIFPLFGSDGNGGSTTPYELKPKAGEAVYTSHREYKYDFQLSRDLEKALAALKKAGIEVLDHKEFVSVTGRKRFGIRYRDTGGLRDIAFFSRDFSGSYVAAADFLRRAEERFRKQGVNVVTSYVNRADGAYSPVIQYLNDWKKPARTVITYVHSLGGYCNKVSDPAETERARLRIVANLRKAGVEVLVSRTDDMSAEIVYFTGTVPVKGNDGDFTYLRRIIPFYETVPPQEADAALAKMNEEIALTGSTVLDSAVLPFTDYGGRPSVLIDADVLKPDVVGRSTDTFF